MTRSMRLFFRISLYQDLYSILIICPLALYIAIVCGNFSRDQLVCIPVCLMAVVLTVGASMIFRYRRLIPFLRQVYGETGAAVSPDDLRQGKFDLIAKEPRNEALTNLVRYIFGGAFIAIVTTTCFVRLDGPQLLIWFVVVPAILPAGIAYGYLLAEGYIIRLCSEESLLAVQLPGRRTIGGEYNFLYALFPSLARHADPVHHHL